jgi:5-(hydroxymethyl)furfural/furfural oxidase
VVEFDAVIVGAGAAGAILAARLSGDRERRIALIEAGCDTPPAAVPDDIRDTFPVSYSNPRHFWPGLVAVARPGVAARPYLQARVMGGGSSVMGMWALRGLPEDYDAWNEAGAEGWSWNDVLPSFNRLERDLDKNGPLHGKEGPIPVRRYPPEQWPGFAQVLLAAAARQGLEYHEDINADFRDGVFSVPVTNDQNGRVSSASGYLTTEVRRRSNLAIMCNTEVRRVLFDGRSVSGVEISGPDRRATIRSSQVILSAGAIGSPVLLLRSGLGPAQELKSLGIRPVADLSGVGRGLQNHCVVYLAARICPAARQHTTLRTYGLACARVTSSHPQGRRGDLHLQFIARTSLHAHGNQIGIIGVALYAPLSKGEVRLSSADPKYKPRIKFRLLEHSADRERLADAIGLALALWHDPEVRPIRGDVFTLLPSSVLRRLNRPSIANRLMSMLIAAGIDSADPIRRNLIRHVGRVVSEEGRAAIDPTDLIEDVVPIFHPVGTCRMGSPNDRGTVVDPDCRVRAVGGLRVIDASIMPIIPTANTCLPTMMIAEHAAKRILCATR